MIRTARGDLLSRQEASASASIDFDDVFSTDYKEYEAVGIAVLPATDNTKLYVRLGDGSTYPASAGNYEHRIERGATADIDDAGRGDGNQAQNQISIHGQVTSNGNAAVEQMTFRIRIINPASATHITKFRWAMEFSGPTTAFQYIVGGGFVTAASAQLSLQFLMSGGNIASGTIELYGIN